MTQKTKTDWEIPGIVFSFALIVWAMVFSARAKMSAKAEVEIKRMEINLEREKAGLPPITSSQKVEDNETETKDN